MVEHTITMNAQLTSICRVEGDIKLLPNEEIANNIKNILMGIDMFDDVIISDLKVFEREVDSNG